MFWMRRKHIEWLYKELPVLVKSGVLTEDNAAGIREYYGKVKKDSGLTVALIIFSIIGSLLIGSGIILLLAHNWQELPRFTRAFLSISPLVASHLLGLWMLVKNRFSKPWREGVAIFNTCAVAAAIALVGQTYHIPGNLQDFLLVWMLLILPIVYIYRALIPAVFYVVGITFWAGYAATRNPSEALWLVPLFAGAVPYMVKELRHNAGSINSALMGWTVSLCLPFGLTFAAGGGEIEGLSFCLLISSIFAVYYLAGNRWLQTKVPLWANPYRILGSAGLGILAWLLTFGEFWDSLVRESIGVKAVSRLFQNFPHGTLILSAFAVALGLLAITWRNKQIRLCIFGALPIILLAGQLIAHSLDWGWQTLVFLNLYVLTISVTSIAAGISKRSLAVLNGGLVLLAALIAARFFDVNMPFAWRGVAFIAIGAAFLAGNIVLGRKMKEGAA